MPHLFFSMRWLSLLLILLLFPFWSVAQDIAPLSVTPPSFHWIAPFSEEKVSGTVLLITKPDFPDSIVSARIWLSPSARYPSFESTLSANLSWSASWDTAAFPPGPYTFHAEFCTLETCDTDTLSILLTPSAPIPSPDPVRVRRSDAPLSSIPPDSIPIDPEPVPFEVTPSSLVSAFRIYPVSSSTPFFRSSGEPAFLPEGEYAVSLDFFSDYLARIHIPSLLVNHSDTVARVTRLSISDFISAGRESYFPVSSFHIAFGFDSPEKHLFLPLRASERAFACTDWDASLLSCRVTWLPFSREGDNLTFTTPAPSLVVALVRPVEDDPDTHPILHSIRAFDGPGYFWLARDRATVFESADGEWVLPEARYTARFRLADNPFAGIQSTGLLLDHNGTILTLNTLPSTRVDSNALLTVVEATLDYSVYSAQFWLSDSFADARVFRCPAWDASTRSCPEWVSHFDLSLPSGTTAFGFFSTPDSNESAPDAPLPDPYLIDLIQKIRRVQSNSVPLSLDSALATYPALSTLFSDMQLALECDPITPPISASPEIDSILVPPSLAIESRTPLLTDSPPSTPSPTVPPQTYSRAFFSNRWELNLPARSAPSRSDSHVSCDGVSLDVVFTPSPIPLDTSHSTALGRPLDSVKQGFFLTNTTPAPLTRLVNIRSASHFSDFVDSVESVPLSEYYRLIPSRISPPSDPTLLPDENASPSLRVPISPARASESTLRFRSPEQGEVGWYDWADLHVQGMVPATVVHSLRGRPIIDTLFEITLAPGETRFLDPVYTLSNTANFSLGFYGGTAADLLGGGFDDVNRTISENTSQVQLVNVDNNAYSNDLLLVDIFADINSKGDAGAIYLIKDIDKQSGAFGLANPNNYSVRWNGSIPNDKLGWNNISGDSVQLLNLDGNAYANDLVITASSADISDVDGGAVYIIKDVDKKSGSFDLNQSSNYDLVLVGGQTSAFLGATNGAGLGVQVVNSDRNVVANDILIGAPLYDYSSRTSSGAIFFIKDINTLSGQINLTTSTSVTASFMGSIANGELGGQTTVSIGSLESFFVTDLNGDTATNDLIMNPINLDTRGTNNGGVYVVKDINTLSGVKDFNNAANFSLRIMGSRTGDRIGHNLFSTVGVQLGNLDGNRGSNDLVICGSSVDAAKANVGAVYLFLDANAKSGLFDLNDSTNFNARWSPGAQNDTLCGSSQWGSALSIVNTDGNAFANDLLFGGALVNSSGRTDNGTIYLVKNAHTKPGVFDLGLTTSYDVAFSGSRATDRIGDTNLGSGGGIQLVNVDNNSHSNDLLITAALADTNALNTGAVFLIRDINTLTGLLDLNTASNFNLRFAPGTIGDSLGDTNYGGRGVILADIDNNGYTNDLLLASHWIDINGKTDAGAVYLIKDIDRIERGLLSLDSTFSARWNGGASGDQLPGSGIGLSSIHLLNSDDNSYTNDLLLSAPLADNGAIDAGSVYFIRDIDKISGTRDLNMLDFFTSRWTGGAAGDRLSATYSGDTGTQFVDVDNNTYSNDLLLTSPLADVNALSNAGAVYLIRDIAVSLVLDYSFVLFLPTSGCTTGKGNITGGTSCQRGYVESTDLAGSSDANSINPEGQVFGIPSIPILTFDNQSTTSTDFNIYLSLSSALPASLVLKAGGTYDGYQGSCSGNPASGCVLLTTTAKNVGRAPYSGGTTDLEIFMWGDFVGASAGTTDRNVDSNAVA